jgi:hypothetical protein
MYTMACIPTSTTGSPLQVNSQNYPRFIAHISGLTIQLQLQNCPRVRRATARPDRRPLDRMAASPLMTALAHGTRKGWERRINAITAPPTTADVNVCRGFAVQPQRRLCLGCQVYRAQGCSPISSIFRRIQASREHTINRKRAGHQRVADRAG